MYSRLFHGMNQASFAVLVLALALMAPGPLSAQLAPLLTGRVHVDLPGGRISSDLCVSDIPLRGDSLTLVLNTAYEIETISGVWEEPVVVEDEPGGTAKRYTFAGARPRSSSTGTPVADVCLGYTGVFPVYDTPSGEYRENDESSLVAFNGRTVRARGISRWHPAIYDPRINLTTEAVRFDLEVECPACTTIFVNGGRPASGPSGRFRSDGVRELLLVAGDLSVTDNGRITYIGETGPSEAGESFAATLEQISRFLEEFTGIPYGPLPDVVDLRPLRKPLPGQLWAFYSDPGLVFIGMTVPELEDAMQQPRSKQAVVGFLAHELSHRYFGWTLGYASPQRDFFGEPFATYLEWKAIRYFFGEEAYREGVDRLRKQASGAQWVTSLDRATANDFAEAAYRYTYSPAMLFALEEWIGEPAMRATIAYMLTAPPEVRRTADFAFLAEAVRAAGVSAERWQAWEAECLRAGPQTCTAAD